MNPTQFLEQCKKDDLKPIKKYWGAEQIYVAEGYRRWHPEYPEPHYLMVWAIGLDEKMDLARQIHVPIGTTQDERIELARQDAREHLRLSKENKRFEAQGRNG